MVEPRASGMLSTCSTMERCLYLPPHVLQKTFALPQLLLYGTSKILLYILFLGGIHSFKTSKFGFSNCKTRGLVILILKKRKNPLSYKFTYFLEREGRIKIEFHVARLA